MNEKVIAALDKLLGINTAAIVSLGAICGGLVYAGVLIGDLNHRLERIEERSFKVDGCASITQCERVSQAVEDLKDKVARLEWNHERQAP